MSLRVLIAGRRPDDSSLSDQDMDDVTAATAESESIITARCDAPGDLVGIVEGIAREHGKISLLDLYDHGAYGSMRIGDDVLFASDGNPSSELVGVAIANALGQYLEDTAQVRLLGCDTSGDDGADLKRSLAGRLLLLKLARSLGGHRVVLGTLTPLECSDFTCQGFRAELEDRCLVSSLAALDSAAPTPESRHRQLATLRPMQYQPLPAPGVSAPKADPAR
jgi:hypothetical protein